MNVADYIVLSYLVPLSLFIILYAARSPWRSNELGVALMFQKIGFSLVVAVIVMSLFLGLDYPLRQEIRTVVYGLVGVALWIDVANLLRYQYRARHDRDADSFFSRWVFRDRTRSSKHK